MGVVTLFSQGKPPRPPRQSDAANWWQRVILYPHMKFYLPDDYLFLLDTSNTEGVYRMHTQGSTKSQPDPMSICAGGSRMETSGISEFRKQKLEHNAQKNWDRFYLRNSTAFFKNRHWPRNEFVELLPELVSGEAKVLLECGCGVGNLAFPLLEYFPDLFVYACDFSPRAIEYVKSNEFYRENRVVAFTTDLTRDALSSSIPIASVDVCTLVFVLSSIDPEKVLKSTGSVFIRDYAQGDYAQQRFGDHQKLEENFYVRQDGTRSYFFTKGRPTGAVLYNIVHVYRSTVESIREQRLLRSVDYLSSQGNGESEGQHLCSKAFHPSQIQESSKLMFPWCARWHSLRLRRCGHERYLVVHWKSSSLKISTLRPFSLCGIVFRAVSESFRIDQKNPFRSSLVITWTIALVMVKAERNVFFFIPNLIGYMRVVLTVLSCYYMATHYRAAALFYVCSSLLDAVDGYAARYFNQSSLFGAMLDMLTDRCTTLCLLCALSVFYPKQLLFFQIFAALDVHDLLGSKSHKNVSSTTSPLLRLYYTSKAFLFLMCFGNEAFFWALYVAHFDPGPIIPLLEVRCMTALAFLSFPIALVKSGISVVHLITAAKSIARIDAKPVR
ncbi:hypothetical protein M514_27729 [Trichuris suis]|uniref:Methyltransferase type 12 domain-containing protein n=1 Tax=Trichuris suis TaxID=68888 RepID=A0A085MS91_9BILA|nr:hypothetical protein M514_27729 [Trichuris suis]